MEEKLSAHMTFPPILFLPLSSILSWVWLAGAGRGDEIKISTKGTYIVWVEERLRWKGKGRQRHTFGICF